MPLQNRERVEACLAKLRGTDAGGDILVLLMTTSGEVVAWQGAGDAAAVASLGAAVARVVRRAGTAIGSRSNAPDQPGPPVTFYWWIIHRRWILAVLGRQSEETQASLQRMAGQWMDGPVGELFDLLPDPQRGWENPKRWSMS